MSEITLILERLDGGEAGALDELIPLVYEELRRQARLIMSSAGAAAAGHTLQPTAVVHEAYAKLVGGSGGVAWRTSRHFFNAAAEVMRQILVDHARAKGRQKRGGGWRRVDVDRANATEAPATVSPDEDWECLDGALTSLRLRDDRRYRVVMLRFFAGLADQEVAACLGVCEKTVRRDWKAAKLFLLAQMDGDAA
jgi:RNA polymerase sigma factor (TIGR02999 family)